MHAHNSSLQIPLNVPIKVSICNALQTLIHILKVFFLAYGLVSGVSEICRCKAMLALGH